MTDMLPNTPARIGDGIAYCVRFPGDEGGDIFVSRSTIEELYAEASATDGVLKFEGTQVECVDKRGQKRKLLGFVGRAPADSVIVRYHDNLSDPFNPDEEDDEDEDAPDEAPDAPRLLSPDPPQMPRLR